MSKTKSKAKKTTVPGPRRSTAPLGFRKVAFRAGTINEEARTIEVVLATETPCEVYDFERWDLVEEVLLMSGVSWRRDNTVPLLDAHNTTSISAILGSITNLRVETIDGEAVLAGLAEFSERQAGQDAFLLAKEGHLKDVSIGFLYGSQIRLEADQTEVINGRSFTGPLNIVTGFTPIEGSCVPIGADKNATFRGYSVFQRAYFNPTEFVMAAQNGKKPSTRNAQEIDERDDVEGSADESNDVSEAEGNPETPATSTPTEVPATASERAIQKAVNAAMAQRDRQRAAFRREVDDLCELADCDDEFKRSCYDLDGLTAVRTAIKNHKAARQSAPTSPGVRIEFGAAGRDKHVGAVRSALFVKVAQHATNDPAEQLKLAPQNERAAGWENFRYASLLDLARECLLADGVNCRGWSGDDVAIAALGGHPTALGHRATWAYNTSSFAGLSRDAVNRSMLNGYRERPSSWRLVFRTAPSVPNFKDIHRLQIGTTGAAPVWPDNSPITELPLGGGEVTYAIEAYAGKRSFSWKAIVNNDLDLISRTPFQLGRTMDRTVNKAAWMQIIKNPLMPDGQTLFLETPAGNRPSSNYTVGATAPTTAVIGAMAAKMALVKGLPDEEGNAPDDVLAVAPKFIAVPVALGTTTDQLVKSAFDPAGGASQVYNTASNLIPVSEPLLDFYGSATAFYLLADPADVDTVEVTFLEGHEEPKITMHTDPETYALVYSAVQAFGAKVVDWRGIQKHKGAA